MVTFSPMVSVRFVQPEKAGLLDDPMEEQLALKTMDVRPLQLEKAELPIEVTLLGMLTDVRLLQP